MIAQKDWKSRCLSKKMLTNDTLELHIERPDGFAYLAGQFIQFFIQTTNETVLRAYSLASHPAQSDLEFCVKLVPGGRGSTFFSNLSPGSEIHFQGPSGRFTYAPDGQPLSLVATGAGIAPIWGIMADELINKKNQQPIHCIFGLRGENDVFWIDRLESLAAAHPNFSYTITLSQPEGSWRGKTGRVTTHLHLLPKIGNFYLCGNPDMVKDVRAALLEKNISPTNIHFEIF